MESIAAKRASLLAEKQTLSASLGADVASEIAPLAQSLG